jgi:ankyrin repeat protein
MRATRYGHTACVEVLLGRGADPDAPNDMSLTPLVQAAVNGDADIVELLLQHGADVGAADEGGWGPLVWAVANRRGQVARRLLEHDARPWVRRNQGGLALVVAARCVCVRVCVGGTDQC